MDPSNEKLLDLIRLTDRSLAQVDSATLQQLVTEDSELLAQAERLELVLHASQSIGKEALWQELDLSDAEHAAEILDGSLALEVSTSAELVRHVDELQSIVSGTGDRLASVASEIASRSLLDAVKAEFNRETAQADVLSNGQPANINGKAVRLEIVERSPRHLQRTRRRPYYAWPIAVGLVVAIVLFVMSLASPRNVPQPQSPIPAPSDFVVTPPESSIIAPDELPPVPDPTPQVIPKIAIDPPREKLVEPLVIEVPEPQRRPLIPEVERPELPESLKWDRVSGIVATQVEGSDAWYPLHADASTSTSNAGDYQLFRTLGNSWAEAHTESGIRVILGPNAVARVAISIGDSPRVKLDIERGKVGVGELVASTQVVVARDAEQSEWLVSNSETELAFDVQQMGSDLQLVQGQIRLDDKAFNGPARVSLNDGSWVAGRLARREPWLAGPPALSPIERQLAIIAKEEGDLVAGLLANRPGMNEFQAHAAAVWGLSLDPARAIPLALASPIAGQRAAAALWLVDPANDAVALRRVLPGLRPLLQGSQCNVPRWISVIRGESPLSQSLVQNMLLGLLPNEPLFVREMALASLMKLSGQIFPSYDIRNPTRQAITQITRTLQPWINQLP